MGQSVQGRPPAVGMVRMAKRQECTHVSVAMFRYAARGSSRC